MTNLIAVKEPEAALTVGEVAETRLMAGIRVAGLRKWAAAGLATLPGPPEREGGDLLKSPPS